MNKLIEGQVDTEGEHFEMSCGSIQEVKPKFVKVGLLAKNSDGDFVYQFTIEKNDANKDIFKRVLKDFEFYLLEHGPKSFTKDGWEYAKYHSTTSSDVYSYVHWSFYPPAKHIEDRKKAIDVAWQELSKHYPGFLQNGDKLALGTIHSIKSGDAKEDTPIWSVKFGTLKDFRAGIEIIVDVNNVKAISCKEYREKW